MVDARTPSELYLPSVDMIHRIADDRIEVKPSSGLVRVDGTMAEGIRGPKFDILVLLASQPDRYVTMPNMCKHKWQNYNAVIDQRARVHVSMLRSQLGVELGDPKTGAIRNKVGNGYKAVSSLKADIATLFEEDREVYRIADDRIAVASQELFAVSDGQFLEDITPTELKLLAELAGQPDKVLSHEVLFSAVWGHADRSTYEAGRVLVSTLRHKLGPELGHKRTGAVRTRHSVGYYAVRDLSDDYVLKTSEQIAN